MWFMIQIKRIYMKLKKRVKPVKITIKLVSLVEEFLGEEGVKFFKKIKEEFGRVDAIWMETYCEGNLRIPHSVHFMEGMMVRNFMRETGLCNHWTCHDFDNNWVDVVNAVLEKYVSSDMLEEIEDGKCDSISNRDKNDSNDTT